MDQAAAPKTRHGSAAGSYAVSALLLMACVMLLYTFSYALLVVRGPQLAGSGWNRLYYIPQYRLANHSVTQAFFYPVHAVDREVRRSYWYASHF